MTKLSVKKREVTGKKVKKLRLEDKVPAVLYGNNTKTINLIMEYADFDTAFINAGYSTLVELSIDDKEAVKVLIHEVTRDPLSEKYQHIDFYQVDMKKKVTANISFNFINEAPAVKSMGGMLVTQADHITIECLPADLMKTFEVDLSSLVDFDEKIRIKDLQLPETATVLSDPNELVAAVKTPRVYIKEDEIGDTEATEEEVTEGEEGEDTGEKEKKETNKEEKKSE